MPIYAGQYRGTGGLIVINTGYYLQEVAAGQYLGTGDLTLINTVYYLQEVAAGQYLGTGGLTMNNTMYYLQEVAAGQYLGTGGLTMIGQLVPMMQGVGYATMTIVFWLGMAACLLVHEFAITYLLALK